MANGNTRIVNAQMATPKTPKGSALKNAMNSKTFESKIISVKGNEKFPTQKGK